jgi:DNA-binding MarR family transcriptional regulator
VEATGDLLMAAARAVRRSFIEAMAAWDITPAQGRALRIVCDEGSVRLSLLAEQLRIAPRSATEVVDALEARGLVERTPDPTDRRAICVAPTDEGHRMHGLVSEARRRATENYLAVLAPADRVELDRILRLLTER